MHQQILKPWGYEIKFTEESLPYTSKILFIQAGKRLSLQYHDQKTETLTLLSGQAKIQLGESITDMAANEGYTVSPNTVHRIEAVSDCVLIEASTPEAGSTVRLEDDYSRPTETEDLRNSPNRGWNSK